MWLLERKKRKECKDDEEGHKVAREKARIEKGS